MGYRCPKCKKDFGNDSKALWKHFEEYKYCKFEASVIFVDRLNGGDGNSSHD